MRILIVNDDGYDAEGINVLAEVFCRDNDVFMVAPDSQRSGYSHSLSIYKGIFCSEHKRDGYRAFSITGTPADCVKLAALQLMKDNPPELVISGINSGPNLGSDIIYSGTVAAACEAVYLQIPSIAISLGHWEVERRHYLEAANFLKTNLEVLCELNDHKMTALNINYPVKTPYKGAKWTIAGINKYSDYFEHSPSNGSYTLKGLPITHEENGEDCDVEWIKKGYATVTPVTIDRNQYDVFNKNKSRAIFK